LRIWRKEKKQKMVKFKHNKKKNSAFLYEALVIELTKAILKKDESSKTQIASLIKESFRFDTSLHQELKLYHSLTKTQNAHPRTAERILSEVLKQREVIDKKRLLSEQNKLVRKIKKMLPEDTFNNFVPNYKSLATIYQIFNQRSTIKTKVLLENQIIKGMILSEAKDKDQMVPIDNLVYKTFTKKFNTEYSGELLKEQKELLSKFVSSFVDNGLRLKLYLNEEISRLKKDLKKSLMMEEIISDATMTNKVQAIIESLEEFKNEEPKKEMIQKVIKVQGLIHEIKSDGVN
jgi:hypothetical protein